jgi:hypothetical protein
MAEAAAKGLFAGPSENDQRLDDESMENMARFRMFDRILRQSIRIREKNLN